MRWQPAEAWKANLCIISFGELIAISGFAIISAFLLYYVEDLGVTDVRQIAIWSASGLASAEGLSFLSLLYGVS